MSRLIDADALEKDGWMMHRTVQVNINTMECQTKKPTDFPTIEPEPHYDEWCTDCKEYDQERHCCPRWNKVIRGTLKDARPEIIWGLHASVDRPLGDLEIVPRLREIQKQIGGSYAIDRAVEVIEAIAERRTDEPD